MQTQTTTSTVITLTLSPEEAKWLHAVMQNPMHGLDPHNEGREDAEMRQKFFLATHRLNLPTQTA